MNYTSQQHSKKTVFIVRVLIAQAMLEMWRMMSFDVIPVLYFPRVKKLYISKGKVFQVEEKLWAYSALAQCLSFYSTFPQTIVRSTQE